MFTTALVSALVAAACAGSDGTGTGDEPWAHEAVELFEAMAADLSEADPYGAASLFVTDGLLDLRAWSGAVHAGSEEIADALRRTLYIQQRRSGTTADVPELVVDVDQVFVGAHEAVVRFDAHTHVGVPWVQLFSIGGGAVITSRLYSEDLGHPAPNYRWARVIEHPFHDRYVDAWASGDVARRAELYAATATIVDALSGERWSGEALDDLLADSEPLAAGPWPELFRFDVGDRHEQIAVLQLEGSCPRLEARRWVFEDDLIVHETRYTHVHSARRCGDTRVEGWWSDLDVSDVDDTTPRTVAVAGEEMVVVNASDDQLELVHWLFGRYLAGGLSRPAVAAFWFPPSIDCDLAEGIAERDDVRFEGRHSVTLCFDDDELSGGLPGRRWSPHVAHQGLHELAHVWMYDNLDEADRDAFVDLVGVDDWRGADVFWPERGVEVAAETIAWGLAGDQFAEYVIRPAPACEELTARYRSLTGRWPLTSCDGAA